MIIIISLRNISNEGIACISDPILKTMKMKSRRGTFKEIIK